MIKLLKIHLVLLLGILSCQAFAGWSQLYSQKKHGKRVVLYYDQLEKSLKIEVKKSSFKSFSSSNSKTYSVDTPETVDATQVAVDEFLSKNSVDEITRAKIIEKIDELKFLNQATCKVLHLDIKDPIKESNLENLLVEIDKLQEVETVDSSAYRSIPIHKIVLDSGEVFGLRLVLDQKNQISNLSIVSMEGDLKGFSVVREGDQFIVLGVGREPLLVIDATLINEQVPRLSIHIKKNRGIQDHRTNHIQLNQNGREWTSQVLASSKVKNRELESEVSLSNVTVSHAPVVKVDDSEVYFSTLEDSEIHDLLKDNLPFEITNNKLLASFFRKDFESCMAENIGLKESNIGILSDEEIKKACTRYALIEIGIDAIGEYYYETLGKRLILEKGDPKNILDGYIGCFLKNGTYSKKGLLYKANISYLAQENIRDEFSSCLGVQYSSIERKILAQKIKNDDYVKDLSRDQKVLNLVVDFVLKEGFDKCLDSKGKSEIGLCKRFSSISLNSALFKSKISSIAFVSSKKDSSLSKKVRNESIESYEGCMAPQLEGFLSNPVKVEVLEVEQLNCLRNIFLSVERDSKDNYFERMLQKLDFFADVRDQKGFLNEELLKEGSEKYADCLSDSFSDFSNVREFFHNYDEVRYNCQLVGFKRILPELYLKKVKSVISGIVRKEKVVDEVLAGLKRTLRRELRKDKTLADIGTLLNNQYINIYTEAVHSGIVEQMEKKFSDNNSSPSFNQAAKGNIKILINQLVGANPKQDLEKSIRLYLERMGEKHSNKIYSLKIAAKDLLRNSYKKMASYEIILNVGEKVLVESDRNRIAKEVDSEYQKCLDQYLPNTKTSLAKHLDGCEKKRDSEIQFNLTKREIEAWISRHFELKSQRANDILTPIVYYRECIEKVPTDQTHNYDEYMALVKACGTVAKIDIGTNLSFAKLDSFKSYLPKDQESPYACYGHLFDGVTELAEKEGISFSRDEKRSLGMLFQDSLKKNKGQSSLLSFLSPENNPSLKFGMSDQKEVSELLSILANSKVMNEEWVMEKVLSCQKKVEEVVINGFRDFLVTSIPSIPLKGIEKSSSEILYKFLDAEVVELLLKFQKLNDLGSDFQHSGLDFNERLVTPELGLMVLTNFMKTLGDLANKGFVFDKDEMKTNLVELQGRLKDFLEWYIRENQASRTVNIGEAMEFFKDTKLSETMSLAVVSERIRARFINFAKEQYKSDVSKLIGYKRCYTYSCLNAAERKKMAWIKAKERRLISLTKEMTASVDFRRIIRPQSQNGERVIDLIKENYLLPKIMGKEPGLKESRQIDTELAKLIVKDDTDGGFSERFVQEVAQLHLKADEESHWAITKYFFYDTGDFDWDTLRKSPAGQKALRYYGTYILLPKIINPRFSKYMENLRMKKFIELLGKAQGEND